MQRLADVADVVIVNQPPKVLERWGCTYEAIAARNPRAVVVSLSLYGTDGPYSARGGNGTLAEAFGGLTHMTGDPDGPPMLPSIPLGDVLGAITGLVGTLVACLARERGNAEGQYVDIAMYEPVITLLSTALVTWQPGDAPPMRTGSRVPGGVPRNTYRTHDNRWVVLSGPTNPQVARVLEVIGLDTPDAHTRYGTSQARLEVADELDALVAAWIAEHDHTTVISAFNDTAACRSRWSTTSTTLIADPACASAGECADGRRPGARAGGAPRADGPVELHAGHGAVAGPRDRCRHRRGDRRLVGRVERLSATGPSAGCPGRPAYRPRTTVGSAICHPSARRSSSQRLQPSRQI